MKTSGSPKFFVYSNYFYETTDSLTFQPSYSCSYDVIMHALGELTALFDQDGYVDRVRQERLEVP